VIGIVSVGYLTSYLDSITVQKVVNIFVDNSFENRFHHRFLLAYQQANFARLQRKNLFFNTSASPCKRW
jgi:hypothetical protein